MSKVQRSSANREGIIDSNVEPLWELLTDWGNLDGWGNQLEHEGMKA